MEWSDKILINSIKLIKVFLLFIINPLLFRLIKSHLRCLDIFDVVENMVKLSSTIVINTLSEIFLPLLFSLHDESNPHSILEFQWNYNLQIRISSTFHIQSFFDSLNLFFKLEKKKKKKAKDWLTAQRKLAGIH